MCFCKTEAQFQTGFVIAGMIKQEQDKHLDACPAELNVFV